MRRNIITFVVAVLGLFCGLVLWHGWDDHVIVDELRAARLAAQAQQAQQIQQFQQQQQQQRAAQAPKIGP